VNASLRAAGLDARGALAAVLQRAHSLGRAGGRRVVVWDEVWGALGAALHPAAVVQLWRREGWEGRARALAAANRSMLWMLSPGWCAAAQ
jgi:hypothetical protein